MGWLEGKQPEVALRPPNNAAAVWDVDQKEGVEEGLGAVHPTIKPVELIRRPILWHTRPGELIYEPFSGSGTALIAAELTGRRCYAIELAPHSSTSRCTLAAFHGRGGHPGGRRAHLRRGRSGATPGKRIARKRR